MNSKSKSIKNLTSAKILAYVINTETNTSALTFLVKFPRIVEAEFLRHRMLGFSAESSRAKNISAHLKSVEQNPFIPTRFPKDCAGMMNKEWIYDNNAEYHWIKNMESAFLSVSELQKIGVHKAIATRPLQPYEYQEMIVSGTEWSNFFHLRAPHYSIVPGKYYYTRAEFIANNNVNVDLNDDEYFDSINYNSAQPEIQILAEMMYDAVINYEPNLVIGSSKYYGAYMSEYGGTIEDAKIAAAKSARISYNSAKSFTNEDNLKLFSKLMVRENDNYAPTHPTPTEHQYRPMTQEEKMTFVKKRYINASETSKYLNTNLYKIEDTQNKDLKILTEYGICNNLRGFIPFRYDLENKLINN